jgi:RNA polymerase sigma-70 factor (ECF subfamily)
MPWLNAVPENNDALIDWIGRCILPEEAYVRAWLRRRSIISAEIDDIVQESYRRIASISNFRDVKNPRAYFIEVARNILLEQLRRSRIVRIDTVAEIEILNLPDDRPDQERTTIAKAELLRLNALINELPARCRTIFVLRKIDGLSQKQIALKLGITENTVETQIGRGLRLLVAAWTQADSGMIERRDVARERTTKRTKRD